MDLYLLNSLHSKVNLHRLMRFIYFCPPQAQLKQTRAHKREKTFFMFSEMPSKHVLCVSESQNDEKTALDRVDDISGSYFKLLNVQYCIFIALYFLRSPSVLF